MGLNECANKTRKANAKSTGMVEKEPKTSFKWTNLKVDRQTLFRRANLKSFTGRPYVECIHRSARLQI